MPWSTRASVQRPAGSSEFQVPKRGVEKTDLARATGDRTIAFNVVTTARCTSSGIPSTAGSLRIEMPSAMPASMLGLWRLRTQRPRRSSQRTQGRVAAHPAFVPLEASPFRQHADPQEADAGLHDLADLLDDPGEHVECAPTTATWLRRRALSPCLSFSSLAS